MLGRKLGRQDGSVGHPARHSTDGLIDRTSGMYVCMYLCGFGM